MTAIQVLVLMLLAHFIGDFTLQIMSKMEDFKQKSWWDKICGGKVLPMYRYDYIAGLICHAMYWSLLVCLPLWHSKYLLVAIVMNAAVHAFVDDIKANRKKINLCQDQAFHAMQIIATWIVMRVWM